ncbi:hypothetical protein JAAARDRAFT_62365 [Jaapia argillacea MUCL 33604]|uniref:Uncharacterized protein n=1 Tax=Jaapia argillacea MUCL 33604 TaxID=933084 RepID=A0A067P9S5_9AGAM|nr:hypothetical protein JAAARDRAFT_62365 [Jaapia argillacea MUCL 33604]
MAPFDDECARFAHGVETYDAQENEVFLLHGYDLFGQGDIITIEKLLGLKGHNGFAPCRSCEIKGHRNIQGGGTNYYYPLRAPMDDPDNANEPPRTWAPMDLPLRTHTGFLKQLDEINTARQTVGSLDYARSFPWDWMHLFLENNGPNLVDLWTGRFKGLDTGREEYELAPHVWEEVGRETAEAVKDIPSIFVRALSNIATDRSGFTAESWAFWLMYLAPILLENRFSDPKYHQHLCELAEIMKTCVQFEITDDELDDLEKRIISWVEDYER